MALLAVISAALLSGVSAIWQAQVRQQQRLACAELANRLILQFLDDKSTLPASGTALRYGPWEFAWVLDEQPVKIVEAEAIRAKRESQQGTMAGPNLDRMREVRVLVWMSDDPLTAGRDGATGKTPQHGLVRLYDPQNIARHPDALQRMLDAGGVFGSALDDGQTSRGSDLSFSGNESGER